MKSIENGAKFILDSGLLFEINRRILHPVGLAMFVKTDDETGVCELGGIIDGRDDPEGILYNDETLKDGEARYQKFCDDFALDFMETRLKKLGYVVQGEESIPEPLPQPEL